MTKNHTLPLILLSVATPLTALQAKEQAKPNVILLMCDDMGWGDVGFNGNKTIQTPNLDQMAEDGVRLTRFYSASAVSSPTRASVLTGRNPYRTGIFTANVGILRPEEVTLPELLKSQGYATGHFGKWHLGTLTDKEKDANRGREGNTKELNQPKDHGYDCAMVTESKVPTWDPMKKPIKGGGGAGWNSLDADSKEGVDYKFYGTHYWDIDGNKVTENLEGDDSRVIMDRVIPFIEQSKSNKDPFLAVVWFHAPHKPCVAGEEYRKLYSDKPIGYQNYAGCITAMDEQVGRLRQFLKDQKIDKNTMIWFCSDNGPENCKLNEGGVTGGFRDRKRSLHEGGIRVPACVVWPAAIKGGQVCDTPMWTCDYLPTIVANTGVDKSLLTNELDGIDVTPIVQGKQKLRGTPFVHCIGNTATYSTDSHKYYIKGGAAESFDVVNDPFEESPKAADSEDHANMMKIIAQYKNSFEGGEYGTASVTRMEQRWSDPTKVSKGEKKSKK